MSKDLLHMLARAADALMHDRMEDAAAIFATPLPVYLGDQLVVLPTQHAVMHGLRLYRKKMRHAGVRHLRPRLIAEGLPSGRQASTWVEWDHLDAQGHTLSTSQVRYSLRCDAGRLGPVIEMLDYKVVSYPDIEDDLSRLRIA